MVEFALAIPVLLMVVYGTLETGRLFFIFASTVTAARQAVRYGSATGDNDLGTPYYQDCAGIKQSAANVGFINVFSDINITYDRGLDASGNPQAVNGLPMDQECDDTDFSDPDIDIQNGDRINVHVETLWEPIAPLVPFNPFPIQADSSRTILESIAIQVTAPVGALPGSGTGSIALDITHGNDPYDQAGDVIPFTFTIQNLDSSSQAIGPFKIWRLGGRELTIDEPCGTSPLNPQGSPGDSTTCSGTYTVIQDDVDNGYFDFTGFALGTAVASTEETEVVNGAQNKELTLSKSANPDATAIVGTVVTYTFTLQNTGNVRLYSPFTVSDDQTGDADCTVADNSSPLGPGETTTCTDSYIIKQQDLADPWTLINHAVATARFQPDIVTSNTATFTVYIPPMILELEVNPLSVNLAGQTIQYNYKLRNNTDSDSFLKGPYSIIDSRFTVACPQVPSPMPVGGFIICPLTYTVTQADMDAGPAITNTAKGQFKWKNQVQESNEVTRTVVVVQSPTLSLQKTATPPHAPPLNAGEVVRYDYVLTNSGNVTLKQPYTIVDDKLSGITCPLADLAPAATKTCTINYTLTQNDKHRGSLVNTATARAMFNITTITSNQASATLLIHNAPRIEISKSANYTGVTGAGQLITYTYLIENTGITNLTQISVTDKVISTIPERVINVDCSMAKSNLKIGETTNCTAQYVTVQADVAAGLVTNQAQAFALSDPNQIQSVPSSVTVSVWHLPNAVDDSDVTNEGVPLTTPVLTNDDLGRQPTSIILYTQGLNGSVTCSAIQCSYTPDPSFIGTDSYTYTIQDTNNNTDAATVTVTVRDLPNAVNDSDSTPFGIPKTTAVLTNDDLGTQPTTISGFNQGANGTVVCTASNCTYTPGPLFVGIDTYTYTITDANNNADTATVTMTVTSPAGPDAQDDYDYIHVGETIPYPVLDNDDLGTQPTSIISWTQGLNGNVTCDATTCTYVEIGGWVGIETYTYTIQDSLGLTDTATVTVNVHTHILPP